LILKGIEDLNLDILAIDNPVLQLLIKKLISNQHRSFTQLGFIDVHDTLVHNLTGNALRGNDCSHLRGSWEAHVILRSFCKSFGLGMLYGRSDAIDGSRNVPDRVTRSRCDPQVLLALSRNPYDVDLVVPSNWIEFFQLQAEEFLRSVAISRPDVKALQIISNLGSELASSK